MEQHRTNLSPISRLVVLVLILTGACLFTATGRAGQGQPKALSQNASSTNAAPPSQATVLPEVTVTASAPTNNPKADKAWRALEKAERADLSPPLFLTIKLGLRMASIQNLTNWGIPAVMKRADRVRDFYKLYPDHPKVWQARLFEYQALLLIYSGINEWNTLTAGLREKGMKVKGLAGKPVEVSMPDILPRMLALEKDFKANADLPDADQFSFRHDQVARLSYGPADPFLDAAKALRRDFPQNTNSYDYLDKEFHRTSELGEEQLRALAREVTNSAAPAEAKVPFRSLLQRMDLRGKPVAVRLTALDGTEVDTANMTGGVLLIVFWKSNLEVLADLQVAYGKFHPQGLEVEVLSFAEKPEVKKLTRSLKADKISMPVHFMGTNALGDLSRQFGIDTTPRFFLLDKRGILRESGFKDRKALDQKIAALLAEP